MIAAAAPVTASEAQCSPAPKPLRAASGAAERLLAVVRTYLK